MNIADIADALLMQLYQFDQDTAPFGLYACEHFKAAPGQRFHRGQIEWQHCLKTTLKRIGCRTTNEFQNDGRYTFYLPDDRSAQLQFTRVSKIKVRQFGDTHSADASVRLSRRWEGSHIERQLTDLWNRSDHKRSDIGAGILILVGFDPAATPFEKEITTLQKEVPWQHHGIKTTSHSWLDRYNRRFSVRLQAWINEWNESKEANKQIHRTVSPAAHVR